MQGMSGNMRRVIKFKLNMGMNNIQHPHRLLLVHLDTQFGELHGWFEENDELPSNFTDVFLAMTGEQVPYGMHHKCSHQQVINKEYFMVHAYV